MIASVSTELNTGRARLKVVAILVKCSVLTQALKSQSDVELLQSHYMHISIANTSET